MCLCSYRKAKCQKKEGISSYRKALIISNKVYRLGQGIPSDFVAKPLIAHMPMQATLAFKFQRDFMTVGIEGVD